MRCEACMAEEPTVRTYFRGTKVEHTFAMHGRSCMIDRRLCRNYLRGFMSSSSRSG